MTSSPPASRAIDAASSPPPSRPPRWRCCSRSGRARPCWRGHRPGDRRRARRQRERALLAPEHARSVRSAATSRFGNSVPPSPRMATSAPLTPRPFSAASHRSTRSTRSARSGAFASSPVAQGATCMMSAPHTVAPSSPSLPALRGGRRCTFDAGAVRRAREGLARGSRPLPLAAWEGERGIKQNFNCVSHEFMLVERDGC